MNKMDLVLITTPNQTKPISILVIAKEKDHSEINPTLQIDLVSPTALSWKVGWILTLSRPAQLAGAVEDTDCISVVG